MSPNDESPENHDEMSPEQMAQFVELYAEHSQRLQFYLMALVPTSHDAVDVLQETSLVLWKKFGTFEIGSNFMAWACKIARLQALKHYQRNSKSAKFFELTVLDKLAKDAQNAAAQHALPLDTLEYCVGKLSSIDQTLIRRRYEHGSSVKKIADNIGRTANSVSKSLGRIRQALLQCMEQQLSANQ